MRRVGYGRRPSCRAGLDLLPQRLPVAAADRHLLLVAELDGAVVGCAGLMYVVERWLPWLGSGIGLKAAPRQPRQQRAEAKLVGERV